MKKWIALIVLAAACAGAALWLWPRGQAQEAWRTARPARGPLLSVVTASGTINPVVNVTVGAPVSGIIKELLADYNTPVHKGQVIARIDPAIFKAQVAEKQGAFLAAQANRAKAVSALADAERTLARYERLVRDGSVAQSEYDSSLLARDSARDALAAASASVEQAKGALGQAQTNLEYSVIRSPVDGVVISRSVDVGQTVAATMTAPTLFTIAQDLARMQIEASVDESDIAKLREGQTATFTVDAYPEARFTGQVAQVRNAAVISSNVVTYVAVVSVDNADLRLKPGMTANVSFEVARRENALKIPAAALRFKPKEAEAARPAAAAKDPAPARDAAPAKRIYVLGPDGKPKPVRIQAGITGDGEVEVLGGLDDNAEVVLESLGESRKGSGQAMRMGPPPF